MSTNLSSKEINNWFERPENRKWLSRMARIISKEIDIGKIPPFFLDRKSGIGESPKDTLAIIESELIALLIEKKDILAKLIRSNDKQISRFICTVFKNHCIDIARHKSQDLRKYLYKRLSDALRNSEKFQTRVPEGRHKFVTFSCSRESRRIPPLTREDLDRISFPYQKIKSLDYEAINRKAVLLDLSEHFWQSVSRMNSGNAVWIEVWSVIEWIGLQVRYDESETAGGIKKNELPGPATGSENSAEQLSPTEMIPDHKNRPDHLYFDAQAVKKWAACFAEQLSQKEKEVCYYGWARDEGLEKIAERLGYKSASSPHYILNQAKERLRGFLRDLKWVSPEDRNEAALSFFLDTLFSILKKSVSGS